MTQRLPVPPVKRLVAMLRRLVRPFAVALLFAASLLLSVVIHSNTPQARRASAEVGTWLLSDAFYGRIQVKPPRRLALDSLELPEVAVFDEQGRRVLELHAVRVELGAWDNLVRWLGGSDKLTFAFPHARIERSKVTIIADADSGEPTLVRAFTPRPSPPRKPSERKPRRELRFFFPVLELGTAVADLELSGVEHIHPKLSNVQGQLLVTPKGVALDVPRLAANIDGILQNELRGTGQLKLRAPGKTQVQLSGFLGNVELELSGSLQGQQVSLRAIVPTLRPEDMRQLIPPWPLRVPVRARLDAEGELSKLTTTATIATDPTKIEIAGQLDLSSSPSGVWEVEMEKLDARAFAPDAPQTAVDATAHVELTTRDGPALHARGTTRATTFLDNPVPPLSFRLDYEDEVLSAELLAQEPGSPIEIDAELSSADEATATVRVPAFRLEESRRIPRGPRGLATLQGDLSWKQGELSAQVQGSVSDLRFDRFQADRIRFQAGTQTPPKQITDAEVSVAIAAERARYGRVHYEQVRATAHGNRHGANVEASLSDPDGRQLQVRGWVSAGGIIKNAKLRAQRHDLSIEADVHHLDLTGPNLDVRRLHARGRESNLDGRFLYRPGLVEGELRAKNIDVGRLASALALDAEVHGTLNTTSEFAIGQDVSRARLNVDLANASVRSWGRGNFHLDAALRGKQLTGALSGTEQTTGMLVGASFDVALGGHALNETSWKDATGSSEVIVSNVQLGLLNWIVPPTITDVEGVMGGRARLQRDAKGTWPSAIVELGANNVAAKVLVDRTSRTLQGVNSYVSAVFDAQQNKVFGSGSIDDGSGRLLTLTAALPLDLDHVRASAKDAWTKFRDEPLNVVANIPQRRFDSLPLIAPEQVPQGTVEGQIALYGSLNEPELSVLLNSRGLAPRGYVVKEPLHLRVSGQYSPKTGKLNSTVVAAALNRSVAMGRMVGSVPWSIVAGEGKWSGEATVLLDRLPLELLPGLGEAEVRGNVSGSLELKKSPAPELTAHVDIAELTAGRARLGNGTLRLRGKPGSVLANLLLAEGARSVNVKLEASTASPRQMPLPHLLDQLSLSVHAQRMNVGALAPAARDFVARLQGDLDADVTWLLQRYEKNGYYEWNSLLEGDATLRRGNAYVDVLGLELNDISAHITATPRGNRTQVEMHDIKAKARSRNVNFEADAQVFLSGQQVVAGSAEALLRSVPLTLKGLSLGKASGQARLVLERQSGWELPGPRQGGDYILTNVELLDWYIKAGRQASRQLIDLDDHPDIVVIQHQTEEENSKSPLPYRILVDLRRNARFSYGDLSVPIRGGLQVDYDGRTQISGTVHLLPGSQVPIFGKRFDVLSGTLQLHPDNPSNPAIELALVGSTPDGDPINLTVLGTLREPVTEPPPEELQALLGGGTATLLGGGVQALGINELLGESVGNIELRVDSTDEEEADPTYGAAVQIGPNLWFEGGYQRSQGSGLNESTSDVFTGAVDYRFHRNWSLKTRLGNAGGGLDLLWQHRY